MKRHQQLLLILLYGVMSCAIVLPVMRFLEATRVWHIERGYYEMRYMREHKCYPIPELEKTYLILECQEGRMNAGDLRDLSWDNVDIKFRLF